MALYEKQIFDGIQEGHGLDYCIKCTKLNGNLIEHNLEYKEVFKLHINGLEFCLCMEHFLELLGKYTLIEKDTLTDEDIIEIPQELAANGTYEEIKEFLDKAVK